MAPKKKINKKTKVTIGLLDGIVYVLTIVAVFPYTMGDMADIFPPKIKAGIAMSGVIAGGILKAMKPHIQDNDNIS